MAFQLIPGSIRNLYQYLEDEKFQVYVTASGHETYNDDNFDQEHIKKRISKPTSDPNSIRFLRYASEKLDQSGHNFKGTNPRVELIPGDRLNKEKYYHIRYEVMPVHGPNFKAYILQLFDYAPNGKGLHIFHITIRNDKFSYEYHEIGDDDSLGQQTNFPDLPVEFGKWYNIDLFVNLNNNAPEGSYRVHINGEKRWSKKLRTASKSNRKVAVHIGIYGDPGKLLETKVRKLLWY